MHTDKVRLIGVIRSKEPQTFEAKEPQTFEAKGESTEEAKNNAEAMVPDGWELTSTRVLKG